MIYKWMVCEQLYFIERLGMSLKNLPPPTVIVYYRQSPLVQHCARVFEFFVLSFQGAIF